MSARLACIAGGPLCEALEAGAFDATELPRPETPFGPSEQVLLAQAAPAPFYLVPRQPPGRGRLAPSYINYRATLYALKDLGVDAVVSWSAAGAITHDRQLGQVVIPDDVIDMTRRRQTTFFETSGLGLLRQFPVFCPALREALASVLAELGVDAHGGGTAAVTEGPRFETPAEVRMLAAVGAELVTHTLVPEVFLARELQMCLVGACYLVNYAETGSRHRPFSSGALFGDEAQETEADRARRAAGMLPDVLRGLAAACDADERNCECDQAMARRIDEEGLDPDWHKWFE